LLRVKPVLDYLEQALDPSPAEALVERVVQPRPLEIFIAWPNRAFALQIEQQLAELAAGWRFHRQLRENREEDPVVVLGRQTTYRPPDDVRLDVGEDLAEAVLRWF